MSSQPVQIGARKKQPADLERARLVRRAKLLARVGVGWYGVEAAIAVGAGLVAGSIALVGFGADYLLEAVAGFVLLWRSPLPGPSRGRPRGAPRSSSPSAST